MEPRLKMFVNLQIDGQSKTLPDMNLFSQGQFEVVFDHCLNSDSIHGLGQSKLAFTSIQNMTIW